MTHYSLKLIKKLMDQAQPLKRLCWVLSCLGLMSGLAQAAPCSLTPVEVLPVGTEYIGTSNGVEFHFRNEKETLPVTIFPEPPLIVKQAANNQSCQIGSGGIWVREHVYVNSNASVLVTHEYSGSNDELVLYDTASCRRLDSVDISDSKWSVKTGEIVLKKIH